MADYLAVDRAKVHVVPHGMHLEGVEPRTHGEPSRGEPLRIGFFARVSPEKGLHLLVEACELLAEHRADLPIELHAGGYLGGGEREYFIDLRKRAEAGPLADRFHYHGELDKAGKYELLRSLDVFSTPTTWAEAKGLPAMEAMAAGVPVVLPRHGSVPRAGRIGRFAGVLHDPNDAGALAEALESLLDSHQARQTHGQTAAAAIRERFTAERMAEETLAVYQGLLGLGASGLRDRGSEARNLRPEAASRALVPPSSACYRYGARQLPSESNTAAMQPRPTCSEIESLWLSARSVPAAPPASAATRSRRSRRTRCTSTA